MAAGYLTAPETWKQLGYALGIGSTSVSVNRRLSSPYVITASSSSGNVTISY
jgi:hypothetical protein